MRAMIRLLTCRRASLSEMVLSVEDDSAASSVSGDRVPSGYGLLAASNMTMNITDDVLTASILSLIDRGVIDTAPWALLSADEYVRSRYSLTSAVEMSPPLWGVPAGRRPATLWQTSTKILSVSTRAVLVLAGVLVKKRMRSYASL